MKYLARKQYSDLLSGMRLGVHLNRYKTFEHTLPNNMVVLIFKGIARWWAVLLMVGSTSPIFYVLFCSTTQFGATKFSSPHYTFNWCCNCFNHVNNGLFWHIFWFMVAFSTHGWSTKRFDLVGWTTVMLIHRFCGCLVVVDKPLVFHWFFNQWITGNGGPIVCPNCMTTRGPLTKLSVGLNLWKSVSRGNRILGHQYAERPC